MLQPQQVEKIRISLDKGERPTTIDGITISSFPIDAPDDKQSVTRLRPRGVFYPPQRVIGQPEIPTCMKHVVPTTILDTPTQVITLENAMIVGNKGVLTKEGRLYNSSMSTKTNFSETLYENRKNHDGFAIHDTGSEYNCYYASRPNPRKIHAHALFLPNWEPSNYGSFSSGNCHN